MPSDLSMVFSTLPWTFPAAMGVLGLLVGSFLNVVIHRLPIMMERQWRAECASLTAPGVSETDAAEPFNLVVPRSRCPHCAAMIIASDNIPLLSYALLGGRCRSCRACIPFRYPLVELAGGLIGATAALHFGHGAAGVLAAVFAWALLALAVIDYDTQLLPDAITLPFLWLGLLVNSAGVFVDLHTAVYGAAAGYLSLWGVYWSFRLATGKEGMGFGDFKLLGMIGAWLGWQSLPLVLLGASAVGAVVGIGLIAFAGHGRHKPIPFGPFLASAGFIALICEELLSRAWINAGGGAL